MPWLKYMLHSAEDFFGKCTNQNTIKDGLGGHMGIRAEAVKQYKNYEKMEKDLKALKKQDKMLFSIANNSGSRREPKNIKNIRAKYSKKRCTSSSNSSSGESDFDYLLSRGSN